MGAYLPTNFKFRPVAVIGGGTLGRRIALMFAAHGATVKIYDLAEEQRDAAVGFVAQNIRPGAGGASAEGDLGDTVAGAWLVVEAIPERLELKKEMFGQLDKSAAAD